MSSSQLIGKVYLVGAGPGDVGLLTVRAKTLLEWADVVLYDALISPEILNLINPEAEKIHVGKRRGNHTLSQAEICRLLIDLAQRHAVIVRLKGGDPFVFGRGGEECLALVEAGITVEVVPGVTSGVAAPAYAHIPLTHRDFSSSVVFVTGHEAAGRYQPRVNWSALATAVDTIVIYMGLHHLREIVPQLLAGGRSPQTPLAFIESGTTPQQRVVVTTLERAIATYDEAQIQTPVLIVIGEVIHLRCQLMGGLHQI
ncbi:MULTISPECIES: uroporphyrinogen-III C-methyltransferase [unclassified Thermosynechococcus]|uniref:uroporphyrinogen-III C-methyltransferase n=1 Tax=unclassified Thermosynechococcus TaxID=2622553 RepID=UPI00197E1485|nr:MULTISPECIES: uroporphyrinogen-III C-methyltransferase [unclassified Thermosynechococcus]QSF48974.1 uroporphyrinogen-III C-methyltransferase [Thermosynechococcus sp. TA-1]WNC22030.1 uroporphyrinogen-III C-methyltransferase [Thermosynechococcus sp. PP22]WNC32269.1 uroporphyrinogen-III C-methyltransferase [Thermosynechococcus sp. PKX95]WNC34798.1 uroporphyrinogen-III C-methyltransferase [Thermosynechococcus sp. PKX91]WNC37314.1 uroporphyrinogen-III C-methyltransferase [Thermosynechococcus sp.